MSPALFWSLLLACVALAITILVAIDRAHPSRRHHDHLIPPTPRVPRG